MNKYIVSLFTTIISILLFLFSLTQNSFCTDNFCGTSIMDLLSGALGFILGGAAITWLANPLLVMSWVSINKKPKLSLVYSAFASIISFSFFFFKNVLTDEAGNYQKIVSYQIGYWLWVSSAFIMFLGSCLSFLINKYSLSTLTRTE